MKEFNKTEDIFVEIWSFRYKIAIILFLVAVITGASTYLITPKYKSVSIVFPVNLYPTSDESSTEQLMQYFNSNDIKMGLAKKYHLFEYYGIDTTKVKGGKALFDYMFKENVSISPTLYESVEITVKDHDPLKAQEINGGILALTNDLIKNNKKYILYQYINNINKTIAMQNKSIDSVLTLAKSDDVFVEGDDKDSQKKNKKVKKLKQKEYAEKVKGISKSYGRILYKRDKFYMDYGGELTFFSLVSAPTVSDKRCYPVRSMFIITAEISTLILCLVLILIRYRIRNRNVQAK